MILMKVDVDTLILACENKLKNTKRKSEITRIKDIMEMAILAKTNLIIYCSMDEADFKLLFSKEE